MKKMKFLGFLLAFSFLFIHFSHAQFGNTTVTRIAGGVSGTASVSLCSNAICLVPWNYPSPSSHTFAMRTSDVVYFVIGYGTGGFNVPRSTVDGTVGFYALNNGTNTLLIRLVSAGLYEFFII